MHGHVYETNQRGGPTSNTHPNNAMKMPLLYENAMVMMEVDISV